MTDYKQLAHSDLFFFYDDVDVSMQNQYDMYRGMLQPRRSMFYNRSDGAGVTENENAPNTQYQKYLTITNCLRFGARRNTIVSDGSNNTPDRRLYYSASSMQISGSGENIDIIIDYIESKDLESMQGRDFG